MYTLPEHFVTILQIMPVHGRVMNFDSRKIPRKFRKVCENTNKAFEA